MCIVFSVIECVFWCSRVTLLSMSVDGSSLYSFCCIFWEWEEWPFLRNSGVIVISIITFIVDVTSLHVWFELITTPLRVICFTIILISAFDSSSSSYPLLFLMLTHFGFGTFFASSLHISLSIWFSSLPRYCYHIHIGHPRVHGSRDFLYMLHFIHEGMGFEHWVFGPSFPSFLSPYYPSLC